MPVAATLTSLQTQIETALKMGPAAIQPTIGSMIGSAIGSTASAGLIPAAPSPIPLIIAGMPATISQITAALSMGPAAQQKIVAILISSAVAVCAPNAPPAGLSFLMSEVEAILSMGPAAEQSIIAKRLANAIITYYTMGGVI